MSMEVSLDTTLTTERLLLRPVGLSDVDLVWEASRVDGFNDGMTWDPPASKEEIVEITHRNLAHWRQGKDYIFTVCLASGISIGRVGLHKEEVPDTWNIGFWIHPDHWGNGYASEAARAVLKFGIDSLCAKRILTAHATWNIRSQRVIEGLGFRYVQTNPAGFYKNGNAVEEYEYELNRVL